MQLEGDHFNSIFVLVVLVGTVSDVQGGIRGGTLSLVGVVSLVSTCSAVVNVGRLNGDLGENGGSNDLLHQWISTGTLERHSLHDGIESALSVSRVLDNALVSIGVDQRVSSLDHVSLAGLLLLLDVSGLQVLYSVGKVVLGRGIVVLVLVVVRVSIGVSSVVSTVDGISIRVSSVVFWVVLQLNR